MNQPNQPTPPCPAPAEQLAQQARQRFEQILAVCLQRELTFARFEKGLAVLLARLATLLVRVYLAARHERLDLEPYLPQGPYRRGDPAAPRTLKTAYGAVVYCRAQLIRRGGGDGFYPLDAVLGLTRDQLSPWVMQFVGRLATRLSFAATRLLCQAALRWAPATETIEQVVLGLGRQAAPFMQQLAAPPPGEGDVLVIEIDGKCPPTATAAELAKRRGRRRPRAGGGCGCQRHRGQAKRKARGPKKRRKKGDKSKNGKEVVLVVLYALKRGADGKLHGPINKKVWASFAGRKAAALWARAEATKRGFGPDTTRTVQLVMDGAKGLRHNLEPLFPGAVVTLDVCHVVEKLWALGHHFHKEGSAELTAWVEELKALLYGGQAAALVERLREYQRQLPLHGPGTKGRREALRRLIGYLAPRLAMMRYAQWREQDLVLASGQVEGAARHVVGERMDCAGMRWLQGKAEAVLQLRCIELNGDWDRFIRWVQGRNRDQLQQGQRLRILTDQPMTVTKAA
ncbi:MAG: hypothetical protein LC620_03650 [Halobacteriales archaeon]|nr:hypothetical protein [Halobacteriales archaeon]